MKLYVTPLLAFALISSQVSAAPQFNPKQPRDGNPPVPSPFGAPPAPPKGSPLPAPPAPPAAPMPPAPPAVPAPPAPSAPVSLDFCFFTNNRFTKSQWRPNL
jgi:hypothetical protein